MNSSVLMVIHEGSGTDGMSNTLTNDIFVALRPSGGWFAPAIMIDRTVYPWINAETPYINANGFDTIAGRVINRPPYVAVNMQGTYNSSTRTINATITAKFEQTVIPADYRITLMLVEDSVIGTGSNYDQKCYDANWANAHFPGQYNSSTSSIEAYPHRFVLRSALLGTWGSAGIIPNTPVVGTTYTTNTSFVVPSGYNASKLYLVGYVARYSPNKNEKYILNSNKIRVSSSFMTDIGESIALMTPEIMDIYPVPASVGTMVHLNYSVYQNEMVQVTLLNVLGEKVKSLLEESNTYLGVHELIFSSDGLEKGLYFIQLKNGNKQVVKKLIIN